MMKMTLSDQERDQREEAFRTTRDRRLRARCQAIRMAVRGRRHIVHVNITEHPTAA